MHICQQEIRQYFTELTGDRIKASVRFCGQYQWPHKPDPDQETEVFAVWDFRYPEVLCTGDQRIAGTQYSGWDLPGTLGKRAGADLAPVSRAGEEY